jgi:hypothetical protein
LVSKATTAIDDWLELLTPKPQSRRACGGDGNGDRNLAGSASFRELSLLQNDQGDASPIANSDPVGFY